MNILYDKLESNEIDTLSNVLTSSKLKKATTNDSPSNDLGCLTSVYVFLEINKLRNNGSFNMDGVMQKSYIIGYEKLVEFINKNT